MLRAIFGAEEPLVSQHCCCDAGHLAKQETKFDYTYPCGGSRWEEQHDAALMSPVSRTHGGAPSPHEKMSQEKSRLQGMALEFFKRAEGGIPVQLVDPCTGSLVPCSFRVDACFQHCCFSGKPPLNHTVRLHDLDEPRKGRDVSAIKDRLLRGLRADPDHHRGAVLRLPLFVPQGGGEFLQLHVDFTPVRVDRRGAASCTCRERRPSGNRPAHWPLLTLTPRRCARPHLPHIAMEGMPEGEIRGGICPGPLFSWSLARA